MWSLSLTVRVDLGTQRPYEWIALGDKGPARAEAEQPNALVTRSSAEEVPHECVTAVVYKADDRDGCEQGEGILRNPKGHSQRISMTQKTMAYHSQKKIAANTIQK